MFRLGPKSCKLQEKRVFHEVRIEREELQLGHFEEFCQLMPGEIKSPRLHHAQMTSLKSHCLGEESRSWEISLEKEPILLLKPIQFQVEAREKYCVLLLHRELSSPEKIVLKIETHSTKQTTACESWQMKPIGPKA